MYPQGLPPPVTNSGMCFTTLTTSLLPCWKQRVHVNSWWAPPVCTGSLRTTLQFKSLQQAHQICYAIWLDVLISLLATYNATVCSSAVLVSATSCHQDFLFRFNIKYFLLLNPWSAECGSVPWSSSTLTYAQVMKSWSSIRALHSPHSLSLWELGFQPQAAFPECKMNIKVRNSLQSALWDCSMNNFPRHTCMSTDKTWSVVTTDWIRRLCSHLGAHIFLPIT